MGFKSYIITVTYFMAILGLAAIGLVEQIGFAFSVIIAGLITASIPFNTKRGFSVPGFLWNAVALLLLLLFVMDFFTFSRDLLISGARFLAILAAVKLFDLKKNRDYIITFSLVFFEILAAAASTISPAFFIILTLFVIGFIWAMIIFNIKKDWEEANGTDTSPAIAFGLPFFFSVIGIAAVSVAITMALFFIIPRISTGFLERRASSALKVSGFSDKVELGAIGPVKTDPTILMRVGLKDVPREVLYFRGTALDYYDGAGWSKKVKDKYRVLRGSDGMFRVSARGKGKLLEQEILLEPLETDYVFAASTPVGVEGRFSEGLRTDGAGSLRLPTPPYSRIEYRAVSLLSIETPGDVDPAYEDASYLDRSPEKDKISDIVRKTVNGKKTSLEKALAIEDYLKSNYAYSLDAGTDSKTPLEDFLLRTKKGYCEHYSSAMVMMLRSIGIPARLVTGFLHGEWNSLGNYLIVRQQDSHSWVEAYMEGRGWMRFDPTPTAIGVFDKPSQLSLYIDLLRWKWSRYVIHYTFADQQKLATTVEGNTARFFASLRKHLRMSGIKGIKSGVLPLVILLAAAAVAVYILTRKRRLDKGRKTPGFYIEALGVLEKKGYKKGAAETPLEFSLRVNSVPMSRITGSLHEERYGGAPLSREALEGLKKDIEELKRM